MNQFLLFAAGALTALSAGAQSAPQITQQPASVKVLRGGNALLSVTVDGGGLTYQWRHAGTNLPSCIISTLAGSVTNNNTGDFGWATNAGLNHPMGVTVDADGNVFIADSGNSRVRRVTPDGRIFPCAGRGGGSSSGDGGYATNANVNIPFNCAVDGTGGLLIAEAQGNRIRQVLPDGRIVTRAGKSFPRFSGDGGPATNAEIYQPYGVSADSAGNIYLADTGNNRIRQVDTNGIINTVVGLGGASYGGDGGAATRASLNDPASVAIGKEGSLYIADAHNNRIRRVDSNGIISTVAGRGNAAFSGDGGAATNASLADPFGIALDPRGNLFISDTGNHRIRRVDAAGTITTIAGLGTAGFSGDGEPANTAKLNTPKGIAVGPDGTLYIGDAFNNRVRQLSSPGPHLVLRGLDLQSAGDYDVVIANDYGSVTSQVATITLELSLPPLQITQKPDQSVLLELTGAPQEAYVLESATELLPQAEWQNLGTNQADSSGRWSQTEKTGPASLQVYRVRAP